MSINEKMTAIADNIREKTGGTEALTLDDMASGVSEVYEAGKQAGVDEVWNLITNKWRRTNYEYAFRNWVTPSIKPPRKIVATIGTRMFAASYIEKIEKEYFDISAMTDASAFANSSQVKEIEDIGFNNITNYYQIFGNARLIHTVARLGSLEETTYDQSFVAASALKNITFSGVIGRDISFSYSPLSVDSIKSVITHLKNYAGTANEYTYTVTFLTSAFEALEAEGASSPNGNTWAEYIDDLKWNLVKA